MPEDLAAPSSLSASIENSRIAAPFQSVARTKVPPDLLSFPRAIPFGLTVAEFLWCLEPHGHSMVLPSPKLAPRNQKPLLSLKAIALIASELGVEVSAIKKTYRFEGHYAAKISSSTSRPWTPGREWALIQRTLLIAKGISGTDHFRCGASALTEEELREKQKIISGRDKLDSPTLAYFGELNDDPADAATDPGRRAFNPDTPRTFFRGSRKPDTAETRAEYTAERERLDGIIKEANFWSPLDPPEYTLPKLLPDGRKVNTKNKRFVEMAFAFSCLCKNHDGQKELAERLGLNYETTRKKDLDMINRNKPFPTTPLPADDRLAVLMGSDLSGNVYVHVTLDRGRWYPLDMDKHDTYAAAIEEVRWKSQDEAWKQAGVPSRRTDTRTIMDNPDLALAFKEVVVRFEEAFNPKNLFILDLRSPTVAAFAEIEWEEQGTVNQSGVIGEGGNQ